MPAKTTSLESGICGCCGDDRVRVVRSYSYEDKKVRMACMYCTKEDYLFRKYGIKRQEYRDRLKEQKNLCRVCGRYHFDEPLTVDADDDGKIRGLVCNRCKNVIGQLEGDVDITWSLYIHLGGRNTDG